MFRPVTEVEGLFKNPRGVGKKVKSHLKSQCRVALLLDFGDCFGNNLHVRYTALHKCSRTFCSCCFSPRVCPGCFHVGKYERG